ncbi:hypothetical protein K227x_22480 [Rubripirellula lacrimiformis]|uniref:Uncharacterized protein n=1 Tax=Rubripirellula lacrimiformis TaxID=1930273 RepID=A0A517N9Q2_9BACT|nr:hypothetical protein [Rubripirellula lacrimiformis]QDT03863.1 hypothetical protein K227x_22480 [Rubripirellula lacrimiformis]
MQNDTVSENLINDSESQTPPSSYARRGALIGCVLGLLAVWRIMSGAIDPTATDHSPIFPAAVMIVCIFAVFVLLAFTLIGLAIGIRIKRTPYLLNDRALHHQEFDKLLRD